MSEVESSHHWFVVGQVEVGGRGGVVETAEGIGGEEGVFFKQKTAYEIMSGDWSSDVCSSD
eukprot:COSAG06_NODE_65082_length_258_cov_0.490566_1_plen_60_part_01